MIATCKKPAPPEDATLFSYVYELEYFEDQSMERRSPEHVNYDLSFPVPSDSWSDTEYVQSKSFVLWTGQYGLRYLAENKDTFYQDMHPGMDTNKRFLSGNEEYDCDQGASVPVYSICDGTVYKFRSEKNDVFVECDELLRFADGKTTNFRNVYRHMSHVKDEVKVDGAETN